MRSRLAEVALACDPTLKADALLHNDDAVRQAAYRSLSLSLQEMREGFERDKKESYNALVANDRLWREPDKRRLLSDLADDAEKAVGDETLMVRSFRSVEDGMRKDHPDWFVADAEEETPTKIDAELLAATTQLNSEFRDFKKKAVYVAVAIFLVFLWQQLSR